MGTEQSAINKFALNDILSGLATGLNDTQKQLRNMAPYDEFGRPNVMYQLPYLDFQLQVNSEFEEIKTETSSGGGATLPYRFGAPKASFKFSTVKNNETKSTVEMKSTISGRFVATAPNDGLPQILLLVKPGDPVSASATEYKIEIEVTLSNTSGEKLKNSLIEFNFDKDLTDSLNAAKPYTLPRLSAGEVKTNDEGVAKTTFTVTKADYDTNTICFVLLVGFATITKSISICKI